MLKLVFKKLSKRKTVLQHNLLQIQRNKAFHSYPNPQKSLLKLRHKNSTEIYCFINNEKSNLIQLLKLEKNILKFSQLIMV